MAATIGCAADQVQSLKADEVKALLDADRKGEHLLLDVRQPEEYADGHISGTTLIPLGELELRHNELDRGKNLIVYCRAGHRSMAAAIALCGLGFTRVRHLSGGILSWPYQLLKGMPEARPELIGPASSHRDVLMLSMKLEKGSIDFYVLAAAKVESATARGLFQTLVAVEERHLRKVYERAVKVMGRGALPPLEQFKSTLKPDYMEGGIAVNPALVKVPQRFKGEMDALEIAVEKEYMSYDFYQRASVFVSDVDTRILLHELAIDERGHSNVILERIAELVRR